MLSCRIFTYALLLLFFTLHHCACATNNSFDPNLMCSLIKNGTTIKDPRACDTWIQCVDGVPVSGKCASPLFYDLQSNDCVASQAVKCISSNPCAATTGTDGFVADPYSCSGYYYCASGTGSQGNCSAGFNFNPGTQDCIRNYPCNISMYPNDYCNIVPDGIFIKNTENCNSYQVCWNGTLSNGTCSGTFYFDAFTGLCNYPQAVNCEPPVVVYPNQPSIDKCTKAGAFISDFNTCNGYFYCYLNASGLMAMQHDVCADGRFFDPINGGACIDRTQIKCGYDRCVGLGESYIQLANESDDECTGFAICQYGSKIASNSCPEGNYFDEQTQLCTTQVVSYPACALSAGSTSTVNAMVTDEVETTTIANQAEL